ncbi:TonB-dependent receptor [Dyadobacter sp. CY327]|uniref:TonB-dependent receptor n=1 Tax=Dyadobacter sp. CY327 TaxID=2907301 RepID=UPI001F47E573|nr:carboxypeptidase-like regulatory domain-containing protein [Dyadobacter sp. CY327]MCE7071909.1 TonB-dependent receptor [Dyadobacter sp. CY327]
MRRIVLMALVMLKAINSLSAQTVTISGLITERGSQESVTSAVVYIVDLGVFSQTNAYGFYSLTIPKSDSIDLKVSLIGYQTQLNRIPARVDRRVDLSLTPVDLELSEVTISALEQEKKSLSPKISTIRIPIQQLNDVPSLLGEKDILKAIQLLPGVQSGTEGSNGLFIRGGGSDQNLILMDEAKVYNISHFFGFFSIFNGDALRSMEFIKGGFPARYGGRISSVLDVQMKEGNKSGTHGEAGIGLLSSRITLEAPIKKGKSSFIISARRSYPDLLLSLAKNAKGGIIKSNFYDVNAKANFELNRNNKLFLSTYLGKDNLFERVNKKGDEYRNMGFSWGNRTATLRWSHLFSPKVFSNLSLVYSNFNYSLENTFGASSQQYASRVNEVGLKYDFEYIPNPRHDIRFGINLSRLNFVPNSFAFSSDREPGRQEIERINAIDGALYAEDIHILFKRFTVHYGIRLAMFAPLEKSYVFVEPRLAFNYNFIENWSLKGAFTIMNQPIQLLTNSGLGLSVDVWVPSTAKMPPQSSRQYTLGLTWDFADKNLSIEVEVYSKKMKNILSFKEGASILSMVSLFRDRDFASSSILWNDVSTAGTGNSRGLELFMHKRTGKLTGWGSYTLSRTVYQFDQINSGRSFYPFHDRRHQFSLVGTYQHSKRVKFSGNYVFRSGNPVTIPKLVYDGFMVNPFTNELVSNLDIIDYGKQRNDSRTRVYNRLDLSVQLIKQKKRGRRTWEFGLYNILGSKNVFMYEADINGRFDQNKEFIVTKALNEVSLLLFVPSISYSFKF